MKKIIGLSLVAALALSTQVSAEDTKFKVSGAAALTTNYIWRGISYTAGTTTAQTGIDMDNLFNVGGLHLNLWGSGIKEGSEFDTIIGYSMEFGKVGVDISFINYYYTLGESTDYASTFSGPSYGEAYINLTYSDFGFTVYQEVGYGASAGLDGTTLQLDAAVGPVSLAAGTRLSPTSTTSYYGSLGVDWECQLLPTYGMNATVAYNSGATQDVFGAAGLTVALTLSKDF